MSEACLRTLYNFLKKVRGRASLDIRVMQRVYKTGYSNNDTLLYKNSVSQIEGF